MGICEGNGLLEMPRRRLEDSINMDLKEAGCAGN